MLKASLPAELARFVRFNTVSSRTNASFARHVSRILKRSGFRVTCQNKKFAGKVFVNVIGIKGNGGRPFLICAHLDTVPPGPPAKWTKTGKNPWKATIKKGSVYGLGTADDKGSLLAILTAVRNIPEDQLKRPLMVIGTFGEESGMGGALFFVKGWKGPKPCCALVGEPTRLGITYRHKGLGVIEIELLTGTPSKSARFTQSSPRNPALLEWVPVTFKGKQGHSSRPHLGSNALEKAMNFLERHVRSNRNVRLISIEGGTAANLIPAYAKLTFLRAADSSSAGLQDPLLECWRAVRKIVTRLQSKKDRSFYPSTITSNFGMARTKGNATKLVFDFRLLPGQSIQAIHAKLKKELSRKLKRYQVKWRIKIERDNPPLDLDRDHAFVRAGKRLLQECKLPIQLSVKPSCTEAGVYSSSGIPAIIFGPGQSSGNIHAPNESIGIKEIERAVDFYRQAIQRFCIEGRRCF